MVVCGRENIRFLRIKKGFLPGCAVVLNAYARNTVFTCLDYESSQDLVTMHNQVKGSIRPNASL
jgi:hypothetical protein